MADITLRTVTRTQGATRALKDGSAGGQGFAFEFEEVPVLVDAFRRMVRGLEFDVSEMAFTTYLCAKAHGKPFTALPVFLVRGFHHGAIVRGGTTGAARVPRDLEGAAVGVNRGYTVTTGVWARGILADEHGVDLSRVTWVLSGDEHVAEYRPPANVVPMAEGGDLADMVAAGELAAGIGLARREDLVPLIPDAGEAALDALRRGFYPINHLVVVRDDVLAAHPGLAADVFGAFADAKRRYVDRLRAGAIAEPEPADQMYQRVMDITGEDPLPYGIAPNRAMIERLIRYAVSQQILDRPLAVESLFAESTHGLSA
jgi:4,5-dihydroxyphthalate decarboxylase